MVPLIGGGKTLFQPITVIDLADSVMAAVNDTATQGKVFELAGPTTYSFKELMALMQSITYSKAPQVHIPWGVAELIGLMGTALSGPTIDAGSGAVAAHGQCCDGCFTGRRGFGRRTGSHRVHSADLFGAVQKWRAIRQSFSGLTRCCFRSGVSLTPQ